MSLAAESGRLSPRAPLTRVTPVVTWPAAWAQAARREAETQVFCHKRKYSSVLVVLCGERHPLSPRRHTGTHSLTSVSTAPGKEGRGRDPAASAQPSAVERHSEPCKQRWDLRPTVSGTKPPGSVDAE